MVLLKKIKKILLYIIVVIEKYKYGLLSLLHLKVTNIYTYNLLSITKNLYKISLIIYKRQRNKKSEKFFR